MILIPKYRDLIIPSLVVGIEGRYRIIKHSPREGSRVVAEFPNVIVDTGLDRMAVGDAGSWHHIGTGNTTPTTSDTSMANWLASSSTFQASTGPTYYAGPPDYQEYSQTMRFAAGTGTSSNIQEVGVGWASGGSSLFSRALIVDGGGNPTSISKAADEVLDVEYILRLYASTSDVTGTKTISTVDYNYVCRAVSVTNTPSWSPKTFFRSSGFADPGPSFVSPDTLKTRTTTWQSGGTNLPISGPYELVGSYTNGTFTRQYKYTCTLNYGNVPGGIKSWGWGIPTTWSAARWQVEFTPVLPKDVTKNLVLIGSQTWARV